MKKVLFAASEVVPFIKTGGLADVVGALPKYINKDEFDVRVILPKYRGIAEKYKEQMKFVTYFYMHLSWRTQYVGVLELEHEGVKFYFIDNEFYFGGDYPYGQIFEDVEKFAFFSKAILSCLPVIDFKPDIIHCNDWQTGLLPVFLKDRFADEEYYKNIKTVMTIHNLKFQGIWNIPSIRDITGLSMYYFTSDKLEFHGDANYLKGGLVYADKITTVSCTYAEEIKYSYYGEGLDGLMQARTNDLTGILNGIDYDSYNPQTDPALAKNYTAEDFRKERVKNKLALQKEMELTEDKDKFVIGIVSRLTEQKGFDLIAYVMDELCQLDDIQIVVLGTGEQTYENMFRHFAWKYPEKVAINIFYNEDLSRRIYAGCDAFLMPSRFEPCGLSQLIALRYGSVPIVRETGGLKDTVEPYDELKHTGTGFSFTNFNAHEMLKTIHYAKSIFENKRTWNKIVENGMNVDYSWNSSAKKYEELYDSL